MSLPQRHARRCVTTNYQTRPRTSPIRSDPVHGSKDASKTLDPSTPPEYPRPTATAEGETTTDADATANANAEQQQEGNEDQQNKKEKKRAEFTQDHVYKRDAQWADNKSGDGVL
ncbi:3983_t:CDS:2 [Acaulospora colombiana]|uniref:3983_t:CDS:1 n=1 Tax=Acaulospora colombiana TaxID=27376 RepID=A0ACA9P4A5_9GLOM|nr:3983_t:CDS:2 [Acaulospora colombiana]